MPTLDSRIRSGQSGFSLIELMVVLGIIVALMALLVPNVRPVLLKRQMMQAMNDTKLINDALMEYSLLRGGAPAPPSPVDVSLYALEFSHLELSTLLVPDFVSRVPETDPWGNPYQVMIAGEDFGAPGHIEVRGGHVFLIRSLGPNGLDDGALFDPGPFDLFLDPSAVSGLPTPGFVSDDIVFADGSAVHWPSGRVDDQSLIDNGP